MGSDLEEKMTPRSMRELADRLERDAQAQLARAKQLRGAAETIEALREMRPLTSPELSTKDSTMAQATTALSTEKTRALARGRGRSKALSEGHVFPKALYDRGLTVTAWAKRNRLSLATVSSWMATSDTGRRRIPLKYAQLIEKEFGLPASAATWPNGITD